MKALSELTSEVDYKGVGLPPMSWLPNLERPFFLHFYTEPISFFILEIILLPSCSFRNLEKRR